jgi:membrane fusion protein (multidrug efflux system)
MKIHRSWYIFILVVVLLALGKWLFLSPKKEAGDNKPKNPVVKVSAIAVSQNEYSDEISVTGYLMPAESVQLQPEVSGKVIGIYFQEGAPVSKGQLLVKLSDSELQAQQKKLKAQLAQARIELDRNRKLWEAKAIAREVYDASQLNVQSLQADVELNEAQIAKTEIRAPFSGTMGNRTISVGAMLMPSTVIATLYQHSFIKVKFFVPVSFRQGLKENMEVTVIAADGKQSVAGIYSIEPSANTIAGSVEVRARLKSSPEFQSGDVVSVTIKKQSATAAVRIPSEALVPVLKGNRVYIIKGGKAEPRDVVTGARNDSSVLILSGLQSGDSLITGGLMFVKPGVAVRISPKKSDKP